MGLFEHREPGAEAAEYVLKRLVREGSEWTLRSDNPRYAARPGGDFTPIAVLVAVR